MHAVWSYSLLPQTGMSTRLYSTSLLYCTWKGSACTYAYWSPLITACGFPALYQTYYYVCLWCECWNSTHELLVYNVGLMQQLPALLHWLYRVTLWCRLSLSLNLRLLRAEIHRKEFWSFCWDCQNARNLRNTLIAGQLWTQSSSTRNMLSCWGWLLVQNGAETWRWASELLYAKLMNQDGMSGCIIRYVSEASMNSLLMLLELNIPKLDPWAIHVRSKMVHLELSALIATSVHIDSNVHFLPSFVSSYFDAQSWGGV